MRAVPEVLDMSQVNASGQADDVLLAEHALLNHGSLAQAFAILQLPVAASCNSN